MKYERHFYESVEAERIPDDPRISDLERLRLWTGCLYTVCHDADDHPTICWDVEGRLVFSEPGDWITKDDNGCLTWFTDADFHDNYSIVGSESLQEAAKRYAEFVSGPQIEPHLSEILQPMAEYDENDLPEWNKRPPVVAYG